MVATTQVHNTRYLISPELQVVSVISTGTRPTTLHPTRVWLTFHSGVTQHFDPRHSGVTHALTRVTPVRLTALIRVTQVRLPGRRHSVVTHRPGLCRPTD
jgi:hypothetical protein